MIYQKPHFITIKKKKNIQNMMQLTVLPLLADRMKGKFNGYY